MHESNAMPNKELGNEDMIYKRSKSKGGGRGDGEKDRWMGERGKARKEREMGGKWEARRERYFKSNHKRFAIQIVETSDKKN